MCVQAITHELLSRKCERARAIIIHARVTCNVTLAALLAVLLALLVYLFNSIGRARFTH